MSEDKGKGGNSTMKWMLATAVAIGGSSIVIGSIAIQSVGRSEYRIGLQEGFEKAAKATGFVGCGKVGEPMMRMPLQECAALREFLKQRPGREAGGKYIVYTDPDITASAPPAP